MTSSSYNPPSTPSPLSSLPLLLDAIHQQPRTIELPTLFSFLLQLQLHLNGTPPHLAPTLVNLLFSCTTKQPRKTICNNKSIEKVLSQFPNYIFIPIDHNARQCAIYCPYRLHHLTKTTFTDDTKHFTILPNTTPAQIAAQIRASASAWFPFLIKDSNNIPYAYIIVKMDGRARPIGSFAKVPHKKLLQLASRALNAILKLTPLKQFTLFQSNSLKHSIASFNATASALGYTISAHTFDVKNFYTEINIIELIKKLDFLLREYSRHYRTKFISRPKHNKKLPPIPKTTTDPEYFTISTETLRAILIYALSNTSFTIGIHVLRQILGLAMG
jgi:hypothetical protein